VIPVLNIPPCRINLLRTYNKVNIQHTYYTITKRENKDRAREKEIRERPRTNFVTRRHVSI